jgi:hydrogenase maturation protease
MSNPSDPGKQKTIVVGLGNDFRNDDGAGLAALRMLRNRNTPGVDAVELRDDLTELLDHLRDVTSAYVIDAVQSESAPGTIHRIDSTKKRLSPADLPRSTHGISLGNLLDLARLQGEMPKKLVIYGIQGERFGYGTAMTPAVQDALSRVVDKICAEIEGDLS